jgi:hypothetical protein
MVPERSISDTLFDLGVIHQRDENSTSDGCHTLYFAGRAIGRYSAHEVCNVMRESGIAQGECPQCRDPVEQWWSYCAMCGWHIASGAAPDQPAT